MERLETPFEGQPHLCQFFTRQPVSSLLVNAMGNLTPRSVLDLGAGAGALSSAVAKRWRKAEVVTVDIDAQVRPVISRILAEFSSAKHRHFVLDALDPDLPAKLLKGRPLFDAAVCNPPYSLTSWRAGYKRILEDASLPVSRKQIKEYGSEALFIAQNLRLTKSDGRVGVIVPDWVITSKRSADLRQALLMEHGLNTVIQIPPGSFLRTDAQAFIIVLTKDSGPPNRIKLVKASNDGRTISTLSVDPEFVTNRLDYDFNEVAAKAAKKSSSTTLSKLKAEISRGNITGLEAKSLRRATFHTTDFLKEQRSIALSGKKTLLGSEFEIALPGDILIARVDRNLHEKVSIVRSGYAILTDCVYRVRVPKCARQSVLDFLHSPEGKKRLKSLTRGVGARMINMTDLLSMPLGISI